MSDQGRRRGRLAIYSMAGIYVLFMAKNIYEGLPYSEGTEKLILIVAMVLFVIIGAGAIIWSMREMYKIQKEMQEQRQSAAAPEAKQEVPVIEEEAAAESAETPVLEETEEVSEKTK